MSSKSRKQNPPPQVPVPRVTGQPLPVPTSPKEGKHDEEHGILGEEVVHVPKGKNRLYYVGMIALLVFLTVIFLVPGAMLQTFLGPSRGDVDMLAYNDPAGGRVSLRQSEYYDRLNGYQDVFELGIQEIEFLKQVYLGIQERRLEHADAARLIVLDDLARDSGILITDEELGEFLAGMQGLTSDLWRSATARYGGATKVEANLKSLLGIRRYLELMGQVARVPDVDAIEKRWAEEHVELAYDYVQVAVADLVEEAKADAPDDAALEAWFAERPDFEKSQMFAPARYRATFAVLRSPEDAGALVERYPDTSGEAPEARAESYYNSVFFNRFKRPEPADGAAEDEDDAEGAESDDDAEEPAEPEEPQSPFQSLDEVRDVAAAEASGFYAAKAWIADLRSRVEAGEEIAFAAEASDLGLELVTVDEPATLQELREHENLGAFVVGPVSATKAGQVAPNPVVEASGLHVVFVDEKTEPALPPFAEIRDQVLESWAKERAQELAVERLAAVRDGFETFEPAEDEAEDPLADPAEDAEEVAHRRADEEAFRAAAEAAGFEVQRRDWLDKSGPPTADPDASEVGHQFLEQHREHGELAEGQVPEPALNRQRTHAFLVRLVGKRDLDIAEMTPQVYQSYKGASANVPTMEVRTFLTGEGLDEAYGISWLVDMEPEEEEPAE
jgi:hypothetical protein